MCIYGGRAQSARAAKVRHSGATIVWNFKSQQGSLFGLAALPFSFKKKPLHILAGEHVKS